MGKRLALGIGLAAVLTVLWVLNCSGPRPRVLDVRLTTPPVEGAAYTVEAVIRNPSHGHGEVDVIFRLRSRATGLTIQESRRADLRPGETTLVRAQIVAPRDSYEPEVEVNYPPR
jgi:hypothetical protein